MKHPISLILVTTLFLFLTIPAQAGEKTDTVQGKAVCKLEGTQSGCCIGKLEAGIAKLKGVKEVKVDAKAGTATIVTEKDSKVSVEDIKKALAEADKGHNHGFKVIQIKQAN